MRILVSACLLGLRCRYDGRSKSKDAVLNLIDKYEFIPMCPEILGGLSTPRGPAERKGDRTVTVEGKDVSEQYIRGADETLKLAKMLGCKYAIMKERSPACGSGKIYDGSFTSALTEGYGVTTELLIKNGIKVFGESQIEELIKEIKIND